ncbi:MAG: ATP-binding protein [Alphaproteobacteria bacterium]|nr:ATP-binding protein [Alphaproteobacteria bacterium]
MSLPEAPPDRGDAGEEVVGDDLAYQALENLVNQFARPLDFLRELVQNSIDAGSPRIAVWLSFVPDDATDPDGVGVLEIHVDDWGEGMDEEIIDKQLTRLFSSTKEDDLTKIGKFGIGFTSIFAIRPDAVLLRTGRQGESWELLFHADRSFDKVRLDEPVAGTSITLFKRMPAGDVPGFVRESRWILRFWCEHSNTPITFEDRTRPAEQPVEAPADPFAAFGDPDAGVAAAPEPADPRGPERINGPMALDVDLAWDGEHGGVKVVVGYGQSPRYGFYNGGLTLLSTSNDDALGAYVHKLGHLSFKVKSDTLEHTLTRDNVLQDEHWTCAMEAIEVVGMALQDALIERTARAVADGEDLSRWHRYLARECRSRALHRSNRRFTELPLLRDAGGVPTTIAQIEADHERHGATLLHPGSGPLADALVADGVKLLDDDPDLRMLLDACWKPPLLSLRLQRRRITRADLVYVLPARVADAQLGRQERVLVETTRALLQQSVAGRLDLEVAEFPGGADEALVVEGPEDAGVFRRTGRRFRWMPGFVHRRLLLLNRAHPYLLSQVVLAGERPQVAAYALAQAILDIEGIEGRRTWRRLAGQAGSMVDEADGGTA